MQELGAEVSFVADPAESVVAAEAFVAEVFGFGNLLVAVEAAAAAEAAAAGAESVVAHVGAIG